MLAFLGYTLAVIITLAIIPAGIAIGIYVFKEIPSGLSFIKTKFNNRKRDSLDIEIESTEGRVEWLEQREEKFQYLAQLKQKERRITEKHSEYENLLEED